jgi:hypothetical protein
MLKWGGPNVALANDYLTVSLFFVEGGGALRHEHMYVFQRSVKFLFCNIQHDLFLKNLEKFHFNFYQIKTDIRKT